MIIHHSYRLGNLQRQYSHRNPLIRIRIKGPDSLAVVACAVDIALTAKLVIDVVYHHAKVVVHQGVGAQFADGGPGPCGGVEKLNLMKESRALVKDVVIVLSS